MNQPPDNIDAEVAEVELKNYSYEKLLRHMQKMTGEKVEFRRYKPFPPLTTEEEWNLTTNLLHVEDNLEVEVIPIEQIPSQEDHR